jgi:4-carboxymuconolactone decarboxylase
MPRLPSLRREQLNGEQRTLYDQITTGPRADGQQHFELVAQDGSLQGPFDAFLLSPALGTALQSLGTAVRYASELSPRTRESAILMVAAAWDCTFERRAHEAVGRAVGLTDGELTALRDGDVPAYADVREVTCARVVRAMLDGDLDDATWADCAAAVGAATIFELSTLVGYYSTLALQLRVFRVG